MSIVTPTTQDINDNIIAQLEASLNRTIPLLPRSFLRVLAKAVAGTVTILYKYAGFIFLQSFVATASFRETEINGRTIVPLIEWGRLIGVGDPKAATKAELSVQITVKVQGGALPINAQLVNPATGITYLTLSGVVLDAPTKTVTVRASADQSGTGGSGSLGNMTAGQILSFANPQPDVAQAVTVLAQTVTGANGESETDYRQRVIEKFQRRPQGGAYADYEQWGETVAGILNVYPYTGDVPGVVDLYVEATEASSGSPDGIPTSAQLLQVLAAVKLDESGLATRRPVGALVNAHPIRRVTIDVEVEGLLVTDPASIQAQIEEGVSDYLLSRGPYIIGLDTSLRKDRITASALGGVIDDIVSSTGGIFTKVKLLVNGTELDVYTLGQGEKAKLGVIAYV